MKILFQIIILCAFFASCSTNYDKLIDEAEELVNIGFPDSAMFTIKRIYSPENLNNKQKARYAIITGRIHSNKNESLSEDSMLVHAFDYFSNSTPTDSNYLKQATLLVAKHLWWKGEKDSAYNILENAFKKTGNIIYSINLSDLYVSDCNFAEFRKHLSKTMQYDMDTLTRLQCLNNYSISSIFLNDSTEIKNAINVLTSIKPHTYEDSLQFYRYNTRNHGEILSMWGKQDQAIALENQVLQFFQDKDSTQVAWSHSFLSRYYLLKGNLSEAKQHLMLAEKFATEDNATDLSYATYMHLIQGIIDYVSSRKIDTPNFALFINKLQDQNIRTNLIIRAKEESNRNLTERNLNLTIEKQREQITAICLITVLLFVCIALWYYISRKKRVLLEKDEELETLRQLITESQQNSSEKDDRFFKKIMLQQLGVIRMAAANPTNANQELLRRMSEIANKEIDVNSLLNWEDLFRTIDYIYDGYYTKLINRFGTELNEKEIRLCCLLRANFSTKEISIVTQQSVRTVYQRKTVVRQKLHLEEKGDIASFLEE